MSGIIVYSFYIYFKNYGSVYIFGTLFNLVNHSLQASMSLLASSVYDDIFTEIPPTKFAENTVISLFAYNLQCAEIHF